MGSVLTVVFKKELIDTAVKVTTDTISSIYRGEGVIEQVNCQGTETCNFHTQNLGAL
jgi:hypothetical protein